MNYLALNTAAGNEILLSVENKDYYTCLSDKTTTSEQLLPKINELLSISGMLIKDIDVFACVVGPGSFTGIRIGVSTVRAFAYALNRPVISVTYFDCLAYNNTAPFSAVVDGGDKKVCYIKNFDDKNEPPKAILTKDLIKYAHKDIVADGNFISDLPIKKYNSGKELLKTAVEKAIKNRQFIDYSLLVPLYLRRSQPEREVGEI